MALVGWVDPATVAERWLDAPEEPVLSELLLIAHGICLAYAPDREPTAAELPAWGLAQQLQTQHLWARSKSGNGDAIGEGGYAVSTYPLVLEARALLRPPTRRGGIF